MSDDLFMLPTEGGTVNEPTEGGAAVNIYAFTKDALKKRMESDKTFDLQTTPILLVSKDMGNATKPNIKDFMEAGLTANDILGVNGPLVEAILQDRTIADDSLMKRILMNTDDISYKTYKDLLGEQVSFIILFHHLVFLATVDNDSFGATFRDTLDERFNVLAKEIEGSKAPSAKNKPSSNAVFGQGRTTITGFWDRLQKDYVSIEEKRRPYADIEGFIIAGADRVLKYLVMSQVELQAGIKNNSTEAQFKTMDHGFEGKNANNTGQSNNDKSSVAETHGNENEQKIAGPIVNNNAALAPSAPPANTVNTPNNNVKNTKPEENNKGEKGEEEKNNKNGEENHKNKDVKEEDKNGEENNKNKNVKEEDKNGEENNKNKNVKEEDKNGEENNKNKNVKEEDKNGENNHKNKNVKEEDKNGENNHKNKNAKEEDKKGEENANNENTNANKVSNARTGDPEATSTGRKSANKKISEQPINKVNITRRGTSIRKPHPGASSEPSIPESSEENNNNNNNSNTKSVSSVAVKHRRSRKLYHRRK